MLSTPSDAHALAARKSALRREFLRVRKAPIPAVNRRIVEGLERLVMASGVQRVGAVWPLPGEIDLRPLCRRLARNGVQVLLPQTPPKGAPLTFRLWRPGCRMKSGRYGTLHPDGPFGTPEFILVPLLAFDRTGGRLGYGGGYYDRTLAALPDLPAVGYAQASQETASLPIGAYDRRLDRIVTEKDVL